MKLKHFFAFLFLATLFFSCNKEDVIQTELSAQCVVSGCRISLQGQSGV